MIALWIIVGIVALVLLYGVFTYNRLVRLRVRTENAWSQIDVQLRRRYDLIPNLVETVKGYAAHENTTLTAVTEARNAAQSVTTSGAGAGAVAAAEGTLTTALRGLLAVSERYPDLKANQNFL